MIKEERKTKIEESIVRMREEIRTMVRDAGGCGEVSPDNRFACVKDPGHIEPHGWELNNVSQVAPRLSEIPFKALGLIGQGCDEELDALVKLITELEEEVEKWKKEANKSKWPKEAAQEYHRYTYALQTISEMPTSELNPDGEEQAAHSMQLVANEALKGNNE